jgi:hypothetical protein
LFVTTAVRLPVSFSAFEVIDILRKEKKNNNFYFLILDESTEGERVKDKFIKRVRITISEIHDYQFHRLPMFIIVIFFYYVCFPILIVKQHTHQYSTAIQDEK